MTFQSVLQILRYSLSARNNLPDTTIKLTNLIRLVDGSRDFGSLRKCTDVQCAGARTYAWKTTNKKHRELVRKQQKCDERKPKEKRLETNQTKETCTECSNNPVHIKTGKAQEPKRRFNPTQMKWTHEGCEPDTEIGRKK